MKILKAIMHWVPIKDSKSTIRLSEQATTVFDDTFWINKIEDSITNKYTREIQDIPSTPSSVIQNTRFLVSCSGDKFIQYSQIIANLLFNAQTKHSISEGFLIIFSGEYKNNKFVCLLKLEGMKGSEANFNIAKKSFEMQPLENILLTNKTRVFKMAFFIFDNGHLMKAIAMDDQINKDEISNFWLTTFLGCRHLSSPENSTKLFFDTILDFSHNSRLNTTEAARVRTALYTEMNSNSKTLSIARFKRRYVPATAGAEFDKEITATDLPGHDFEKAISSTLSKKTRNRKFLLEEGITVLLPQSALENGKVVEVYEKNGLRRLKIDSTIKKD